MKEDEMFEKARAMLIGKEVLITDNLYPWKNQDKGTCVDLVKTKDGNVDIVLRNGNRAQVIIDTVTDVECSGKIWAHCKYRRTFKVIESPPSQRAA